MGKIDVWTMHKSKRVLVTDEPGVPTEVLGYASPEAAKSAQERGHATISELAFNAEDWKMFDDWSEAEKYAHEIATPLGYAVEVQSLFEPWADPDDFEDDEGYYIDWGDGEDY